MPSCLSGPSKSRVNFTSLSRTNNFGGSKPSWFAIDGKHSNPLVDWELCSARHDDLPARDMHKYKHRLMLDPALSEYRFRQEVTRPEH